MHQKCTLKHDKRLSKQSKSFEMTIIMCTISLVSYLHVY